MLIIPSHSALRTFFRRGKCLFARLFRDVDRFFVPLRLELRSAGDILFLGHGSTAAR
jgi:hypothetical protein